MSKGLHIINPYTEKTFAVVGTTQKHKDDLKTLGGFFVARMKQKEEERMGYDAGFCFNNELLENVQNWMETGELVKAPDKSVMFVKSKLAKMNIDDLKEIKKYIKNLMLDEGVPLKKTTPPKRTVKKEKPTTKEKVSKGAPKVAPVPNGSEESDPENAPSVEDYSRFLPQKFQ